MDGPLHFQNGDGGHVWRLLNEGAVELYFVGASVTAQKEGWAEQLAAMAKQRTGHPHVLRKNTMGGVGLLFGVANYSPASGALPRIVIVEFSTGDLNLGLTPLTQMRPLLVELIDRARAEGAPIVFVHHWRSDFESDDRAGVRRTYDEVAREHAVPVIENQRYVAACLAQRPAEQAVYFRDMVHTHPAGAALYAAHTLACFEAMADAAPGTPPAPGAACEHRTAWTSFVRPPAAAFPRELLSQWRYVYPSTQQAFEVFDLPADVRLSFVASGQLAGVGFIAGPRSGWVSLSVDGKGIRRFRCFDRHCYYDRYVLLSCAADLHASKVEFVCEEGTVDFGIAAKPHADFALPRLLRFVHLVGVGLRFD